MVAVMSASFSKQRRGKAHTSVTQHQRDRQAKLGQLELDRLFRKARPRCVCQHGPGVHTDDGCQMTGCDCRRFGS